MQQFNKLGIVFPFYQQANKLKGLINFRVAKLIAELVAIHSFIHKQILIGSKCFSLLVLCFFMVTIAFHLEP